MLGSPELSLYAKSLTQRMPRTSGGSWWWRRNRRGFTADDRWLSHASTGSTLSTELEDIPRVFLSRTKAQKIEGSSCNENTRKMQRNPRSKSSPTPKALRGNLHPTALENASDALNALQPRRHVETKCISASPRHPHKEEPLLRASKHVPTHHLVLGKRTRTGFDSNRKTHEQSRSSNRQLIRCTWGESLLVRKRGLFWRLIRFVGGNSKL